jgi:lipoyl-dependent peroxiredoxin
LSAMKIVAGRLKVKLPASVAVDVEVDVGKGAGHYLIQARFNVILPGIQPEVAQTLIDGTHEECPYSIATHGNINVVTTFDTRVVEHAI